MLIVGWAFVGAASYLLISFWYRRTTATRAGIKAFVINVVGDVGLVLGTYFIFKHTGTLDFLQTFKEAPHVFHSGETDIVVGCLLLLVGAIAKSAQIPLHTWLPDAMEGPTPVSALIHAATMVTAGVYLIARMHVLFELAPAAQDTGAVIGAVTLLIAGTIALVQTDIKRVIAYSTMSQIGYMIMGVSVGAYAAGLFHLMTHAFFKALLFMAAGSIIGAMSGEQSLERMGGFRKALPFTFACFVIGGLALSGIPPFSGFFSKDEVLLVTAERGGWHWALYVMGYLGAFLTAIYTFRMIFRAFYGEPVSEAREIDLDSHPPHLHHAEVPTNPANGEVEDTDVGFPGPHHTIAERAMPMKVAMVVLAFGSVCAGLVQIPGVDSVIVNFLRPSFAGSPLYEPHTRDGLLIFGMVLGTVLGLTGIGIAYRIWVREPSIAVAARERFAPVYELLVHKWYFDELIDALVVKPVAAAGRFATGHVRARVRAGHARRRDHRDRARGLGRGARGAERLRALLRGPAGAGPDGGWPLLPAAELTMPPLSIMIWLPAACGVLGGDPVHARRRARADAPLRTEVRMWARARIVGYPRRVRADRRGGRARVGDRLHRRILAGHEGTHPRNERRLDRRTGDSLQARDQRPERVPGRPDDAAVRDGDDRSEPADSWPTRPSGHGCSGSSSCSPSRPCSARSWPRIWRCSCSSST